jgi:hypothetical protein
MATCPTCRTSFPEGVEKCPTHGELLLPAEAFQSADGDLPAGQQVSEYIIENKLGEGGFGAVYGAVQPLIGKRVAVKVLSRQYSSNPQIVSRFIAEARAVNQIRHRNIIDIFSFGTLPDGRQFYVMELLEGMTLDKLIHERRGVPIETAVPILRSLARALDAAHAQGIAHRDLKPENIFLMVEEEGTYFPKLLDFGIAKLLADSSSGVKTRTGTPIGTPYYMSPEQCRGKDVDHRTDIYSFGIVVHEMLTGQLPFTGDSIVDLLVKQTSVNAVPMSSVRPDLSPALDAPVLHMLEKDPARRPASVGAAIEELALAAQSAGHSVRGLGRSGAEIIAPVTVRQASATGGGGTSDAALAQARTIAHTELSAKTLLGSETPVTEAPKRKTGLFAGLGALAVVVAAVAYLGAASGGPERTGAAPQVASASATPLAAAPPEVVAAPVLSAPSVVVAPVPTTVEITVQSTPAGAEIFQGTTKLGVAPGPVSLPRGDAKVKLTVKAATYAPATVEVTPSDNATLFVTLQKTAAKPGKPGVQGDLENPFGN